MPICRSTRARCPTFGNGMCFRWFHLWRCFVQSIVFIPPVTLFVVRTFNVFLLLPSILLSWTATGIVSNSSCLPFRLTPEQLFVEIFRLTQAQRPHLHSHRPTICWYHHLTSIHLQTSISITKNNWNCTKCYEILTWWRQCDSTDFSKFRWRRSSSWSWINRLTHSRRSFAFSNRWWDFLQLSKPHSRLRTHLVPMSCESPRQRKHNLLSSANSHALTHLTSWRTYSARPHAHHCNMNIYSASCDIPEIRLWADLSITICIFRVHEQFRWQLTHGRCAVLKAIVCFIYIRQVAPPLVSFCILHVLV